MDISERENWLVLSARGDLDLSSAPRFATALTKVPSAAERVVVDLSAVDIVDATGIGLLAGLQQRLASRGGRLVLAGCPTPLVDRLAEGGMGGVFESAEDVASVVGGPTGGGGGLMATERVVELTIPSSNDYLALARSVVVAAAAAWPGLSEERLEDLRLAVSEACANAIEAHALAGSDAAVRIRCALGPDRVEVEVLDEGGGFELDELGALPPVTDPERLEHESGLGIPLMRSHSDHAEFVSSPGGTNVRLVLYAPSRLAG